MTSTTKWVLGAAGCQLEEMNRRKTFPRDHPILVGNKAFILRNVVLELYRGASGDQCLLFLLLGALDCYLCKKREASLGLSLSQVEREKIPSG